MRKRGTVIHTLERFERSSMERTSKPSTRSLASCLNIVKSVLGRLSLASRTLVPVGIAVSLELRDDRRTISLLKLCIKEVSPLWIGWPLSMTEGSRILL